LSLILDIKLLLLDIKRKFWSMMLKGAPKQNSDFL